MVFYFLTRQPFCIWVQLQHRSSVQLQNKTRMHSSRMRTAHSLTVSCSICQGGACMACMPPYHTCPPSHMPPAMHATHYACSLPSMHTTTLPHTPPCHAHHPSATNATPCHPCPPTMPPLPHMLPPAMHTPCHVCPPATHAPPLRTDRHLWKHDLCKLRLWAVITVAYTHSLPFTMVHIWSSK